MSQATPTPSPSTAATARPTPEDQRREELDHALSQRFIALDPSGYFLIKIDRHRQELVAEHYGNIIDERGLATDPETGEVIRCQGAGPRVPVAVYRGRTAKELGMLLTEGEGASPISRLDHALYLGREFQKAEQCLACGEAYIQD
ncbi:MAG: DUF4346 domain-containing protein [Cyanobacteriota bacterium]|nr:DUF4346 domain-containing protein [Cyanobacteriota bacterium]